MGVKLVSSGGGSVEINAPATASGYTATMPAGSGTVVVNGVGGALVSATAVASTSGTSIDFTGIPSWVKRITVMFNGVSTNGSSDSLVRLGTSSGFVTTGYLGNSTYVGSTNSALGANSTIGFNIKTANNTDIFHGIMTLALLNAATNTWVASHSIGWSSQNYSVVGGGSKILSDLLTQIRITTVNGTDTFDAGSINIMYE